MSAEEHLSSYYREIVKYTRFLHYTFRTFMVIQKNSKEYSKTTLFFQGLNILREVIIQYLYDTLFNLIVENIELFQNKKLKSYSELQYLINLIGSCGYTKYKSIKLENNEYSEYQFISIAKETQQKSEVEYETDFFKKKFTNSMVKYLQTKYRKISNDMSQLSTPEYVQRSLQYL